MENPGRLMGAGIDRHARFEVVGADGGELHAEMFGQIAATEAVEFVELVVARPDAHKKTSMDDRDENCIPAENRQHDRSRRA
jgi:hypothetical protein